MIFSLFIVPLLRRNIPCSCITMRGGESASCDIKGAAFSSLPPHCTERVWDSPVGLNREGHPYRLLNAKNKRVARSRGEGNGGKANALGRSLSLSFLLHEWINWVVRGHVQGNTPPPGRPNAFDIWLVSMVRVCICTFSAKTRVGRLHPVVLNTFEGVAAESPSRCEHGNFNERTGGPPRLHGGAAKYERLMNGISHTHSPASCATIPMKDHDAINCSSDRYPATWTRRTSGRSSRNLARSTSSPCWKTASLACTKVRFALGSCH